MKHLPFCSSGTGPRILQHPPFCLMPKPSPSPAAKSSSAMAAHRLKGGTVVIRDGNVVAAGKLASRFLPALARSMPAANG